MLRTIDILARAKELTGKKFKCTRSLIDRNLVGKVVEIELFGNGQELYYGLKINNHKVPDLTGFEEWEEVQEPVSFMEAVNSGKLIKYERWNIYNSLNEVIDILDAKSEEMQRKMINGKWYIKGDELK